MADPKEEKIEKKPEETGAPSQGGELSDAEFDKASGGAVDYFDPSLPRMMKPPE
jgi:hypothetical protein